MTVVKVKPILIKKVATAQPLSPKLSADVKLTGGDKVSIFDLFKKFVVVGGDFA